MPSISDVVPNGSTSVTRGVNRYSVRLIIGITGGFLAIAIGWYYAAFVYAHPVTRFDELGSRVDQRVTFRGVFDRSSKAYELIMLDGHPIRFSHTLGGIDWSPDTGEECRVVGTLRHEPYNLWGIPYHLTGAEFYPLQTDAPNSEGEPITLAE